MSRKPIKPINWTAIAELLHESDKPAFAAFRTKSDQYLRRMLANPETTPKLDWGYYKKHIAIPGLVDKFQKDYESLSIPYPSDKYTSQIEAQEKQLLSEVQQFIQESNKRIEEYKQEINKVKSLLPYSQMTMEDFRDAHPELALDPVNRPTVWPHDPEIQPEAFEGKQEEHHH